MDCGVRPVTALQYCSLSRLYLLAGEGQDLKIFDAEKGDLVLEHRLFKTEVLHGFCIQPRLDDGQQTQNVKILAWGGQSVCMIQLDQVQASTKNQSLNLDLLVPEFKVDDRILDAIVRWAEPSGEGIQQVEIFLITSHSELVKVRFDLSSFSLIDQPERTPCGGIRSFLCCAHILDSTKGRTLVAGGTALGKVLLWSFDAATINTRDGEPCLQHEIDAHQGSVFGVSISDLVRSSRGEIYQYLVSCSDDRTIRVWDITENSLERHSVRDRSVASAMGHASRIWNVRWFTQEGPSLHVLSCGEDATSQLWRLDSNVERSHTAGEERMVSSLSHVRTFAYHSGKNLWALASLVLPDRTFSIATGGADGRIVSYPLDTSTARNTRGNVFEQCTVRQISETLNRPLQKTEASWTPKSILRAMKGSWDIERRIRSVNPLYPSGTLTGVAKINERPASDDAFEDEYFYSEQGEYITEQGLRMRASRQYVYRYQMDKDKASAWFVKTDGSNEVDYLFHEMNIEMLPDDSAFDIKNTTSALCAKGHHLCIKDDYNAEYAFNFDKSTLNTWKLKYAVKGPEKDYMAEATYARSTEDATLTNEVSTKGPCADRQEPMTPPESLHADNFKTYAWLDATTLLATTEQGSILRGTLYMDRSRILAEGDIEKGKIQQVSWSYLNSFDDLSSGSFFANIPRLQAAFILGITGNIYLFRQDTGEVTMLGAGSRKPTYCRAHQLSSNWNFDGKLGDGDATQLVVLSLAFLASLDAKLCFYDLQTPSTSCARELDINLPKNFTVTSSFFSNTTKLIMLGSREGALGVYDLSKRGTSQEMTELISSFQGIHRDAITQIVNLDYWDMSSGLGAEYILTTGRDGRYAIHKFSWSIDDVAKDLNYETVHESIFPFGPNIEGACLHLATGDLILWGFRSTCFVVWNETRSSEILTIECGGAHRNWAYIHSDNVFGGGNFVWTKASVCNIYAQHAESHRIFQEGGHGREIKTVAVFPMRTEKPPVANLIATGAEDTVVRLFKHRAESGFRCIANLTQHTTGVQRLQWSSQGNYLFSAGSFEELFAWRMSSIPKLGVGTVYIARCPKVTADGDLRLMDCAIIPTPKVNGPDGSKPMPISTICVVYSDSSFRIFNFSKIGNEHCFEIQAQGLYSTHSLTQIVSLGAQEADSLCTGSADGYIGFWPLDGVDLENALPVGSENRQTTSNGPALISTKRILAHQSGIKSLICRQLNPKQWLLISGGDDQALAVSLITPSELLAPGETARTSSRADVTVHNAHASAITGLACLNEQISTGQIDFTIASVGTDQRLKIWRILCNEHKLESGHLDVHSMKVVPEANVHSSVADASALDFTSKGGEGRLYVVGVGMECWRIAGNTLALTESKRKLPT